MGDIIARIFSEDDPGAGFESVEPNLEDVYFCVMKEIPALETKCDIRSNGLGEGFVSFEFSILSFEFSILSFEFLSSSILSFEF